MSLSKDENIDSAVPSGSLLERLDSVKGKLVFAAAGFALLVVGWQVIETGVRLLNITAVGVAVHVLTIPVGFFAYATILNQVRYLTEGWKRLAILCGTLGAPVAVMLIVQGVLPMPGQGMIWLATMAVAGSGCGFGHDRSDRMCG